MVVRFAGTFDSEVNFGATSKIFESSKFKSLEYTVWDLSEVTELKQLCNYYINCYHSRQTGWQFKVSDNMEEIRSWITGPRK